MHAQLALDKSLCKVQDAFYGLFENFPIRLASCLVKLICFPFGRAAIQPSDKLKREAAEYMMQDNAFRQELKKHVYYSTAADEVSGRMENAFLQLLKIEPLWDKFKKAESKGQFKGLTFEAHIADALTQSFISEDEAQQLTPHEVKTVITRISEGSKIVLIGDPAQIDNPYVDSRSNGLVYAHNRMKGQSIAAHVTLSKGERSRLAELAADLL